MMSQNRFLALPRLPNKDAVLRQDNIGVRDFPARVTSVICVMGLSAAYLPLNLVLMAALGYLVAELVSIPLQRRIWAGNSWGPYLLFLGVTGFGASMLMRIPYEMWQLPGFAPKLFAFCTLTSALLHSASVRAHHLPLVFVTAAPVVVVIWMSVVASLLGQEDMRDIVVGLMILGLMVFYISIMMLDTARAHRVLVRAREDADAASEAKGRFLAAMSHEIRTPLNGILGISYLMREDAVGQEDVERADVLVSSALGLKTLVDDVLEHAKVEASKLALKPVAGDLGKLAADVMKLFDANAQERGLWLRLKLDPGLPKQLMFDPVRVRQILSNLVSNAIKFTDEGGVEIHLLMDQDQPVDAPRVILEVSDTGVGIPTAEQGKLFRSFSQVDDQDDRAAMGTGLGLAISRGLAELMEGSISVESELGAGSVFRVNVATALVRAELDPDPRLTADTETADSLVGVRILLVDDNTTNRFVARSFLKPTGAAVTEAVDGAEALELVSTQRFDLILMDMHMPVMDGRTAFRKIRQGTPEMAAVPVVALTADSTMDDPQLCLKVGMDGYLSKPLSKQSLMAEVQRQLARKPHQTAAE